MVDPFVFSTIPRIIFGPGKVSELPFLIGRDCKNILLITGRSTTIRSLGLSESVNRIQSSGINLHREIAGIEPTPALIDGITHSYRKKNIDLVIGAGGGSVMDAAKAVSAMLNVDGGVKDYLEGFKDSKTHPGTHVKMYAIPTTSGTGSEATKNAVVSETGPEGFKRSLRHDNFIPALALIDPELVLSCPPDVTAASGMDAFTQLLESYVSTKANPFTDALAFSGLKQVAVSLEKAYDKGSDIEARTGMAYAALCSGITLANAGLGTVHGFASSVGGRFDIPHGVICGTLLADITESNIKKLRSKHENDHALKKYAEVGEIFNTDSGKSDDFYLDFLIMELHRLTEKLKLPNLSESGFDKKETEILARSTSCKNNPVKQSPEELIEILGGRL